MPVVQYLKKEIEIIRGLFTKRAGLISQVTEWANPLQWILRESGEIENIYKYIYIYIYI